MSYIEPHKIKDGVLHCPQKGVGVRACPLPHDSFRYDCPACGLKLVRRDRTVTTVLHELIEVQEARSA